jgi:hypothetical protein
MVASSGQTPAVQTLNPSLRCINTMQCGIHLCWACAHVVKKVVQLRKMSSTQTIENQ